MSGTGARLVGGDRLKQLGAFCHSARLGSFTRAADYLSSNQSTVSQQVRGLERELDLMLFERSGPNIRLTPIGRELFHIALPVVMDTERLRETFEERYRGLATGRLVIAASTTCAAKMVAGHLERFREEQAGTRVTVKIGSGAERVAWLRGYEVELVFGAMDVVPPDLEFRCLFTSRVLLIARAGDALARDAATTVPGIVTLPMIAHPPGHYTRDLLDGLAREAGVRFRIVMELLGWDAIKRHVETGAGVAIVPELTLDESDRVERIVLDHRPFPPRRYGVYSRREGTLSLPARRFLALVEAGAPSGDSGG